MILNFTKENIKHCASLLREGKIVSFPTETVYGLGASALNNDAVRKIFEYKNRPQINPLIVHIYSTKQIEKYCIINDHQKNLIKQIANAFWPGPISMVLPKNDEISDVVSAGKKSIALRMPHHKVALSLLEACDLPISAPSANPSGYLSPTLASHVDEAFKKFDIPVLDGGACEVGLESTVVSLLQDNPIILRHGFITKEKLENALGLEVIDGVSKKKELPKEILSPGMLLKHYSPRTPLFMTGEALPSSKNSAYVAFKNDISQIDDEYKNRFKDIIFLSDDKTKIANQFFSILHKLDALRYDFIMIDSCEEKGLGIAIMDRVTRATNKEKLDIKG